MSTWILIGPAVGAVFITVALVMGYGVIPPMIIQKITEVRKYVNSELNLIFYVELLWKIEYILNIESFFNNSFWRQTFLSQIISKPNLFHDKIAEF